MHTIIWHHLLPCWKSFTNKIKYFNENCTMYNYNLVTRIIIFSIETLRKYWEMISFLILVTRILLIYYGKQNSSYKILVTRIDSFSLRSP